MKAAGTRKNLRRALIRAGVSLFSLVILTMISLSLIRGGGILDLSVFSGSKGSPAETFYFEDGKDFADLGGALAVVGPRGVSVFDVAGAETASETVLMSGPVICSGGDTAAAYDLGGTAIRLLARDGIKARLTAADDIISASMSEGGYLAVCTRETGYKGMVTVYNSFGEKAYEWHSGSGYILAAAVTQDNKELAVLTLSPRGSKLSFFSLGSDAQKAECLFEGELILDIRFLGGGTLFAVGRDKLYTVRQDGRSEIALDYTGKVLGAYSIAEGFGAFVINDYQVGAGGEIYTVDKGRIISSRRFEKECVSVSAKGEYVAALWQDELTIYDKSLEVVKSQEGVVGRGRAVMRSDGSALAAGARSAQVYS